MSSASSWIQTRLTRIKMASLPATNFSQLAAVERSLILRQPTTWSASLASNYPHKEDFDTVAGVAVVSNLPFWQNKESSYPYTLASSGLSLGAPTFAMKAGDTTLLNSNISIGNGNTYCFTSGPISVSSVRDTLLRWLTAVPQSNLMLICGNAPFLLSPKKLWPVFRYSRRVWQWLPPISWNSILLQLSNKCSLPNVPKGDAYFFRREPSQNVTAWRS